MKIHRELDICSHLGWEKIGQRRKEVNRLSVVKLGRQDYKKVWELQKQCVIQRQQQLIDDTLILVEHNPVYTLGKNADENHLLQSRRKDVPVYFIERGGDVTFHGPGQLVGYPILDLHNHKMSISWYMHNLEEVIIRTLLKFGIISDRKQGLTGVWVGDEKIAALGVRISRWVTMHGFALNVNTDLNYFDNIIPCGIFESGVTSMSVVLNRNVDLIDVEDVVIKVFKDTFGFFCEWKIPSANSLLSGKS